MSITDRNREMGNRFEAEFAAEMGLERVPGSGNQFHSKLDETGFGARWSLKATIFKSFPLSTELIDEAVEATVSAVGGTGELPLWAIRLEDNSEYDLVVMRKADFKRITSEGITLSSNTKAEERRARASMTILERQELG